MTKDTKERGAIDFILFLNPTPSRGKNMNEKWIKAAGIRAVKTIAQTLASTLPVGFAITPTMIENADWSILYVVLAWLGTGILSGIASVLTSLAGLPEVDNGVR